MDKLLPQINNTDDLQLLDEEQLNRLAEELREYMLAVVAENGGHLAPNLGTVELTLALHRVFRVPADKIIWDVGHQSYTHKILTGRRQQFATLRTLGGISGFPNVKESPADTFNTGHSSTSISAALGLAIARDLAGQSHQVVAVIGDGALTGGMAYEALNHAGDTKTRMLVVLNDNEMSIANNVGAISQYLTRLRSNPRYNRAKVSTMAVVGRIPKYGRRIQRLLERMKDTVKYFFMSRKLFEELGFVYYGPIDGHDIAEMTEMLRRAQQIDGPVLLHVLTVKGRGYEPAEKDPQGFHGTGPFDIVSGKPKGGKSGKSYTQIFSETILEEAKADEKLVAISAAMADGVGLLPFAQMYPGRFFDVGIAEQHGLTFAAGLAAGGYKPVVALYSSFLQRGYDQVLHDICLPCLPVVLAVDRAGLVGEDGATHQGMFDISYLRGLPNLRLLAPGDGEELKQMLQFALTRDYPVAIRYPRGCPEYSLPYHEEIIEGKGVLLRPGSDVLLAACGSMAGVALAAADILAKKGVEAAVINARFIAPLDEDILLEQAALCGGRVLTLEENIISGGFGTACLEALAAMRADVDIAALPRQAIEHGAAPLLRQKYGLTPPQLGERVYKRWFARVNADEK